MPSYITECHAPDNSTFVVVCADPSWDAIHSDQIPSNVNYLLINNTRNCYCWYEKHQRDKNLPISYFLMS